MGELLITRFPPGAAGKFVSTVLQTSYYVDHWNSIVQQQKNINEYVEETTLEYCNRSFPADLRYHIQCEPMVPYSTELYSTTFARGNDVTADQYWAQKDPRIQNCVKNELILNLIFNKSKLPSFCKNSKVITILVTTKEEQECLDQLRWNKHFIETQDEIIHTPWSIEYCSLYAIPKLLKYRPQWSFNKNQKDKIYNDMVVNNETKLPYTDKNFFRNEPYQNIFLNLKDIFDEKVFISKMEEIFTELNLGSMNHGLINKMHKLWLGRQQW